MPRYLPSVGMEVHAELTTRTKMFCRCPAAFGGEPNTRVCPVCLGLPGALPVPNREAIEMVLRTALALNCTIAMDSIFHRKNYFYPDLPKGYQISQYGETNPLGYKGHLEIPLPNGETKTVRIRRVHLEEDTGKLMHLPNIGSGIDFNRAGVPLMEIVTDFPPDIETAEEVKAYLQELRHVLLYLGVCDGKMEQGALRCEPNISIRPVGADEYGTKTELKNLNSFRSVQLGVEYEVKRQAELLDKGESILQETRGWHEGTETSFLMRTKETEQDYRYFPDPDLAPMSFEPAFIDDLRSTIPELPLAKSRRYQQEYGLDAKEAARLVADRAWAEFFEEAAGLGVDPRTIANWMNSDFAMHLNADGLTAKQSRITPAHLADLVRLIQSGEISGKLGKEVFAQAYKDGRFPTDILKESGKTQISDLEAIRPHVQKAVSENPDVAVKFRTGQAGVLGYLVGQTMKSMQGRGNPERIKELLIEELEKA